MSEGRRGSFGSGGFASSAAPSAMPTRSAPSAFAFALISAAVSSCLNAPTTSRLLRRFRRPLLLQLLERLQLLRDDALIAVRTDPAHVPLRKAGQLARAAVVLRARLLEPFDERDLLRRLLGDHLLHVREVGVVVVPDGAHREAARTVAERADDAQQPLPEAEEVARAEHRHLVLAGTLDHAVEELEDLREAEFLRLGRALSLGDPPVQHRVGGARVQAPAARLADAHLLGDALVGLELELGQDAGEVEARAELRREDVDLEPERAESRLDPEVARGQPAVARALERPLGLLRRGHERGMTVALQLFGKTVGEPVHLPQHQHVEVLHRDVGLAAERPRRDAVRDDDDAAAIRRDALWRLRPERIGREGIEGLGGSDADEIGAQFLRAALDARSVPACTRGSPGDG